MKNLAGDKECDQYIEKELEEAGIQILRLGGALKNEVPSSMIGFLNGWEFERAWYYWRANASGGIGLPFDIANELHDQYGEVVRVEGHCGCPSPKEWYKDKPWYLGVAAYHVDTQEGLNALVKAIKQVANRKGNCNENQ